MKKRIKQRLLNGFMAATVVLSSIFTPMIAQAATTSAANTLTRIGGVDAYETAALIAQNGWTGTTDSVVLSSGISNSLVDALSAGPLAAELKAPILLTDGGQTLNSYTKTEIQRLKPKTVYITSGSAVIKSPVIDEIKAMGITTVALGGFDQYETSVNIAKEMISLGAKVTKVVVAAGWVASVDALSVSSVASKMGMPILATTHDTLPPTVKTFLSSLQGVTDSYVIGGTAVVGDAVQGSLPGTVHRFSGVTKYDTNLEVLKGFAADIHFSKVYVANGDTFVDALSGVSLATLTQSPILLSQNEWTAPMKDFLTRNKLQEIVALGGEAVVPDTALKPLSDISSTTTGSSGTSSPTTTPGQSSVGGSTASGSSSGSSSSSTTTTPTTPTTVTVSNLRVNTDPSNSLGSFSNGAVIDLSGLPDSVKVLGFSVTADQDCTLQFKVLNNIQNIPLTAGVEKDVTIGDLIVGSQIQTQVNLGEFRLVYTTKTLVGQLLKDGTSAGTLTVTLKFK